VQKFYSTLQENYLSFINGDTFITTLGLNQFLVKFM